MNQCVNYVLHDTDIVVKISTDNSVLNIVCIDYHFLVRCCLNTFSGYVNGYVHCESGVVYIYIFCLGNVCSREIVTCYHSV